MSEEEDADTAIGALALLAAFIPDFPVSNCKAIMGAVFIQYLAYAIIYVIEGSKYSELHPPA